MGAENLGPHRYLIPGPSTLYRVAIPNEQSHSTIVVILTVITSKLQAQDTHKTSNNANTSIAET